MYQEIRIPVSIIHSYKNLSIHYNDHEFIYNVKIKINNKIYSMFVGNNNLFKDKSDNYYIVGKRVGIGYPIKIIGFGATYLRKDEYTMVDTSEIHKPIDNKYGRYYILSGREKDKITVEIVPSNFRDKCIDEGHFLLNGIRLSKEALERLSLYRNHIQGKFKINALDIRQNDVISFEIVDSNYRNKFVNEKQVLVNDKLIMSFDTIDSLLKSFTDRLRVFVK